MIELTKEQKEQYLDNEAINYHTENIVFLAEITGEKDLINQAKRIEEISNKEWCMPHYLMQERDTLFQILRSKINLNF